MKTKPVRVKLLKETPTAVQVKFPAVHVPVSIDRTFFSQWLEAGQVKIAYIAPFPDSGPGKQDPLNETKPLPHG